MVHPDHQSVAEANTPLPEAMLRRYRWFVRVGCVGLLTDALVVLGLVTGFLPGQGHSTIAAIIGLVVTVPTFVILLITGMSKGRDRRPSVMEMFGAGGRH